MEDSAERDGAGARRIGKRHLAVAAILMVGAGGVVLFLAGGGDRPGTPAKAASATADITRGDLVDTTSVDGILTYAGERRLAGQAPGTVTSLPAEGRVIEQGDALYRVNRRPVVLMYGRLPLYRTLRQGMADGPDVRQLERALASLGRGGAMTVDEHFSPATARSVRAWQRDNGLAGTGSVDTSQVVFWPSAVRVTGAKVRVGDRVGAGRQILAVTGTRRVVHVDLDAGDQGLAREGAAVTVELPGGVTVRGKITSVGTVARKKDTAGASAGASEQGPEATIDVDIALAASATTGRLDQAPVTVTLRNDRRENVLSVPIEALLALREGGYGVEVVGAGGTRRIATVTTGAYGGGRVEISGSGLAAGMRVGVPEQ
jgi:peptidoglycan hydrolase-like protein with peptidoglycan-binding domain